MVNLTYAGTQLVNGRPSNNTSCVTGFDQAGFVMGSSASLFNVRARVLSYGFKKSLIFS
jgi:lysophospholipase